MAVSSNNVEEEFLWTCSLTEASKDFDWSPEDPSDVKDDDESDPTVKPGHRLLVKSAILMPSAKKDEINIVQIEGEGYNKEKVIVPIVAMKGGADYQTYVDLLVPCPAKFSLLQGSGPIHLMGSHCVDFYGYRDTGAGDESQDDIEGEDEAVDEKEAKDLVEEGKGEAGDGVSKKTPVKSDVSVAADGGEKMKSPGKAATGNTPAKEDSKKRKASTEASAEEPKGDEKKRPKSSD